MAGTQHDDGPPRPGRMMRTMAEEAYAPRDPAQAATSKPEAAPERYTLLSWDAFRWEDRREPAASPEEAVIGAGAMGRVLLALDERMGRVVAIKETTGAARGGNAARRFLREARVTGALEHPGIVPVHDIEQRPGGASAYTMRLVRGRSLQQALDAALTLRQRLALLPHVVDLCHAIGFAHSQGIIHRDIKPANVMVGEFGETVLLDWGLARPVRVEPSTGSSTAAQGRANLAASMAPTRTGPGVMGTPATMSPEQARGLQDGVDEASDIWALGAILYRLLTGDFPAGERSAQATVDWLQEGREAVEPVRARCPEAPAELSSVAMRCLRFDKSQRYPSAQEMARDLERYMAGERVVAHRYGVWELTRHVIDRNRPLSVAVALGLVVAVAAGVFWSLARQARIEAEEAQRQRALEQLLLAREALDDDRPLEAEARLRQSLEQRDSLLARALWSRIRATPLLLRSKLETEVTGLAFDPEGRRVAVASASPDLLLLESWTGARQPIAGPGRDLYVVAWSGDGAMLAAGSGGGEVALWSDLDAPPRLLEGHGDIVSTIAFHPGEALLASGSFDGTARLWDLRTGEVLQQLEGHDGPITCVSWAPDGASLATAGADGTVRLWDRSGGEPLHVLEGHEEEVTGLVFLEEGRLLISASYDGSLRGWDPATGEARSSSVDSDARYTILRGSDSLLAAGDWSGRIHAWSPASSPQARQLEGPRAMVFALDVDPTGTRVASGGTDRGVSLWNPSAAGLAGPQGHEGVASAVDLFPDGQRIASGGWDGTVRLWDRASGAQLAVWQAHQDSVTSLRVAPDGERVATGSADRSVRVYDAATGRLLQLLSGHYGAVQSLAYSPDGVWLASAGDAGLVYLWELASGARRTLLDVRGRTAVAFGPRGRLLALGWSDAEGPWLRVQERDSGRALLELNPGGEELVDLAFDAEGERIFALERGGALRGWHIATGEALDASRIEGRGRGLSAAGGYLAAGSTLPDVFLFDAEGERRTLEGHRGPVPALRFDATGSLLATAGADGTVRTWDPTSGRPAWRGTALLPHRGLRHSHEGWSPLGDESMEAPGEPWAKILAERARLATESPSGTLCLQTWDGAVELWAPTGGEPLVRRKLARAQRLVATPESCAVLDEEGAVTVLHPAWAEPLALPGPSLALGSSGSSLLLASPGRLRLYDAEGFESLDVSVPMEEPTAVGGHAGLLLVGDRGGGVLILRGATSEGPSALPLQDTPSSPATVLLEGPAGTVAAGFADGTVGLWDAAEGTPLFSRRIHGAVRWLALHGGALHAMSELGGHTTLALEVLEQERCGLLREVWGAVPVCWEGGVRGCAPPRDHPCAGAPSHPAR
jgi:WD40 repeat protein